MNLASLDTVRTCCNNVVSLASSSHGSGIASYTGYNIA